MTPIHQLLTSLTAIVMTLSAQVGNLSQSVNPQTQLAQVAPTSGLVGYWKFDEGSGTTASDSSGNGNTGTLTNGPTWTTGKIGGALSFNNTNSKVSLTTDNVAGNTVTICTWMNTTTVSSWQAIIGNGQFSFGPYSSGSSLILTNDGGSVYFFSPNNSITANGWIHTCAIRDNSGSGSVFINGTQVSSGSLSVPGTGYGLAIGYNGKLSGGLPFKGSIDEVRIYNRALSVSEISDIYNDTSGSTPPPPPTLTPPSISSFSSSPSSIQSGQSSTLSWSVTGNPTPTLSINPGNINPSSSSGSTSVSPSQTTTYTLTATNSQGSTNANTTVTVTATPPPPTPPVPDTTPPSVPSGLTATAVSSSQINLSWNSSTDPSTGSGQVTSGVTGYRIYRGGTQIGTSASNSYSDTGLSPSTQYSYTVQAYDAASNVSSQSSNVSAMTQNQSVQGVLIDSSRTIDWSKVGVTGGIPNRTTICQILSPGATAAQINTAITNCPIGQVVKLNAGTYNLTSGIDFNGKNNVTLRGAGPDQTFLNFTGSSACRGQGAVICIGATNNSYYVENPANVANWTSGYTKGTTQITLSATTGLSVGMVIVLDQLNDSVDTGGVFVCDTVNVCADEGGTTSRPGRAQQQFVKVTAINGNTVTINPGLHMPNWRTSQNPQAWWGNSAGISFGSGVEDLSIDNSNNTSGNRSNITLIWAYDSWVKNVRSLRSDRNHVWLYETARSTVRDSYFDGTRNASSQSYGIESFMSSDNLIENNIFQHIVAGMNANGPAVGTVYGYNFAIDDTYTASPSWMQASNYLHAGGADMILHEGNDAVGFKADVIHGTHNFTTVFRNYFTGWEPGKTSQTNPVKLYSFSRYMNFVGNVLGTPSYHTNYESYTPTFVDIEKSMYVLGDSGNLPASKEDPLVRTTLLRWGNYDTVTGSRFNANEVPSGLSQYANPIPASQSLPASLYLSSRPSWWGSQPWPAIGPDVTGGNVSGLAGHVYKIPARLCYESSTKGTNNILINFNANTCYYGGSTPPPPPTTYTITSSAGSGGTITPGGTITLNSGSSQTFTFTPNTSYRVSNVVVNGISQGSVSSYTFNNITSNQSISVSFSLVTPIVGDFNSDGLVNSIDLSLLTGAWNTSNSTYDLNRDGLVNSLDYTIMVQNWSL